MAVPLLSSNLLAVAAANTATFGSVSFANRLSYALGQLLLKRAFLVVLLAFTGCVLLGGIAYKYLASKEYATLEEGAFKAYSLLNNVPGADATADETFMGRTISQVLYMAGVATFAVIIGIVSDKISSSVESIRTTNERVQEVGHTVIINWGDFTRPMMRQLEAARKEGRLSGPVVVLSDTDKEVMDEAVGEELRRIAGGLSVHTRFGSPVELNAMDRVAAGTAKRIIIIPGDGVADDAQAEQLRDSTGLALALQRGIKSRPEQRASVVVAAPPAYESDVVDSVDGFGSYAEVKPQDFISRILAQCAVQPALSHVYAELLLQGRGSEIYTEPLEAHKSLHGLTFGEASRRFGGRAISIGLVRRQATEPTAGAGADDAADAADAAAAPPAKKKTRTAWGRTKPAEAPSREEVLLAPSDDLVVGKHDSMVLIAGDKSATRVTRARRAPSQVDQAAAAAAAAGPGSGGAAAAAEAAAPLRVLLLNTDPTMPEVIEQIDEVCPRGSKITLLAPERPEILSRKVGLAHSSLTYLEGDPSAPSAIQQLRPEDYDAVVCLQPGGGTEADDSKLLVSLLALQQTARARGVAVPRVVAEVTSPSMLELIDSRWPGEGDNWDFVLSHELCAGILVQFALQPELQPVYSELLQRDGKEFFLQPASRYCAESDGGEAGEEGSAARAVTFEQLARVARARGEVAIGIHRAGEKRPILNPPRDLRLKLRPGDQLVVLGDSF
jgi:hypothetical protein